MSNTNMLVESFIEAYFEGCTEMQRYEMLNSLVFALGESFLETIQSIALEHDFTSCATNSDYDSYDEEMDIAPTVRSEDEMTTPYDANIEYLKSIGAI